MRALITGVTGQDGSYLAEFLLEKGYEVFGLIRRTSQANLGHAEQIKDEKFHIIHGDLTDQGSLNRAVFETVPDEVYNLGAQSFVGGSWNYPVSTVDITGVGSLRLLEALRQVNPKARFYQASSSEMFGNQTGLLDENTPFKPRSPYGFAKVLAHQAAVNYRESYGMFISCGILFNHESPRRGNEFVTKKIVNQAKEIFTGSRNAYSLGALEPRRDWGYAKEYVEAMWLMLQQDKGDDYVIGTGVSHSIGDFVGILNDMYGIKAKVEIDPAFKRPAEILDLRANGYKAYKQLGWKPQTSLAELIRIMMENDR
jgi:GDPmannose 4,6-dehydratase